MQKKITQIRLKELEHTPKQTACGKCYFWAMKQPVLFFPFLTPFSFTKAGRCYLWATKKPVLFGGVFFGPFFFVHFWAIQTARPSLLSVCMLLWVGGREGGSVAWQQGFRV
jgi:hypothetical protein